MGRRFRTWSICTRRRGEGRRSESRKSKVEGRELKVESRKSKVESRKSKVESRKSKVESRKSKVESRKSKVESRKSKVRATLTRIRRSADSSRQRTALGMTRREVVRFATSFWICGVRRCGRCGICRAIRRGRAFSRGCGRRDRDGGRCGRSRSH